MHPAESVRASPQRAADVLGPTAWHSGKAEGASTEGQHAQVSPTGLFLFHKRSLMKQRPLSRAVLGPPRAALSLSQCFLSPALLDSLSGNARVSRWKSCFSHIVLRTLFCGSASHLQRALMQCSGCQAPRERCFSNSAVLLCSAMPSHSFFAVLFISPQHSHSLQGCFSLALLRCFP